MFLILPQPCNPSRTSGSTAFLGVILIKKNIAEQTVLCYFGTANSLGEGKQLEKWWLLPGYLFLTTHCCYDCDTCDYWTPNVLNYFQNSVLQWHNPRVFGNYCCFQTFANNSAVQFHYNCLDFSYLLASTMLYVFQGTL